MKVKMNYRRILIVLGIIFLFAISVFSAFMIRSYINFSKKEEGNIAILAGEQEFEANTTINTNYLEETVSPNAEVIVTQMFKKCGHSTVENTIAPREIVNLTEEKVTDYYEGWSVDEFSKDKIKISREKKGICPEHYVLRESDGYISISSKNDIGEYIFKGLTDISIQYLSEEDLAQLEKGIEIVGKDNLNKYLEDFE